VVTLLLVAAAWLSAATGVAVALGKAIRLADRYAQPCEDAPDVREWAA
jgi:hypothetical protein